MKRILVIDGQGGGMGKQLVSALRLRLPDSHITAVGTNSAAAGAMRKAGADVSATGENAVLVACRKAEYIVGPIAIVIADALSGEISPRMAAAVGQADAKRILLPVNHCDNVIVGVPDLSMSKLVEAAVSELL